MYNIIYMLLSIKHKQNIIVYMADFALLNPAEWKHEPLRGYLH